MITLLIISHEQEEKLSLHLPTMLSQQGVEYEVVVVDMNSEDNTLCLLKSLEETHHQLRHLSLPSSARDISRERLALHLGMRAALASRVILLSADTNLLSNTWLADIESRWRTDCDIMLIPNLRERSKGFLDYFCTGHETWHKALLIRQITKHQLYRVGSLVIGLTKEHFLTHIVPAHQLALKTGTIDIFVAHHATPYNTVIIKDTELFPQQDACTDSHHWRLNRLFDIETRHHLTHTTKRKGVYCLHILCTIHRGSLIYMLIDIWDHLRWRFTSKKTFLKKHY